VVGWLLFAVCCLPFVDFHSLNYKMRLFVIMRIMRWIKGIKYFGHQPFGHSAGFRLIETRPSFTMDLSWPTIWAICKWSIIIPAYQNYAHILITDFYYLWAILSAILAF